jgi:hypothetical protein
MAEINVFALVEKLIDKTNNKETTWTQTSREDEYKINLNSGAITVSRNYNEMTLIIYNDNSDQIFFETYTEDDDNEALYSYIKALHTNAKNSYYKVEETLTGILDELSKDGSVGKEDDPVPPAFDSFGDDLPF